MDNNALPNTPEGWNDLEQGNPAYTFNVTPEFKEKLENPSPLWELSAVVDQENNVKTVEYIENIPKDLIKKFLDAGLYPYSGTVTNWSDFGKTKVLFYLLDDSGKYWGTKEATPEKIEYMNQLMEKL